MSKIEKKVEKFLKNPLSFKYADIEIILIYFGFEKINAKGSHIKFKHFKLSRDLVIPVHKNECKDFYKFEVKKRIKEVVK
jgi:predicted RNA binding protein YcfA (HicA-like mRNA interferase family)